MTKINPFRSMLFAGMLLYASAALSAPIAFDCDVPADRFSSVSQDVAGTMTIKGAVQLVQMRTGNNLPVAGIRLVSADGDSSIGFQLVAASVRSKKFDVVLNIKRGKDLKKADLTQIATDINMPFSLTLDESGKVQLTIAGNGYSADFMPMSSGNAMAFCSTAQFKFSQLSFSSTRDTDATSAH